MMFVYAQNITADVNANNNQNAESEKLFVNAANAERNNDIKNATKLYEEALKSTKSQSLRFMILHRLAVLNAKEKNYLESEKYFRLALKDSNANPAFLCDFAKLYIDRNQLSDAETILKNAILIAPKDRRSLYNLGQVIAQQKDRQIEGLRYLKLALGEKNAYKELAKIYRKLGSQNQADFAEQQAILAKDDSQNHTTNEPANTSPALIEKIKQELMLLEAKELKTVQDKIINDEELNLLTNPPIPKPTETTSLPKTNLTLTQNLPNTTALPTSPQTPPPHTPSPSPQTTTHALPKIADNITSTAPITIIPTPSNEPIPFSFPTPTPFPNPTPNPTPTLTPVPANLPSPTPPIIEKNNGNENNLRLLKRVPEVSFNLTTENHADDAADKSSINFPNKNVVVLPKETGRNVDDSRREAAAEIRLVPYKESSGTWTDRRVDSNVISLTMPNDETVSNISLSVIPNNPNIKNTPKTVNENFVNERWNARMYERDLNNNNSTGRNIPRNNRPESRNDAAKKPNNNPPITNPHETNPNKQNTSQRRTNSTDRNINENQNRYYRAANLPRLEFVDSQNTVRPKNDSEPYLEFRLVSNYLPPQEKHTTHSSAAKTTQPQNTTNKTIDATFSLQQVDQHTKGFEPVKNLHANDDIHNNNIVNENLRNENLIANNFPKEYFPKKQLLKKNSSDKNNGLDSLSDRGLLPEQSFQLDAKKTEVRSLELTNVLRDNVAQNNTVQKSAPETKLQIVLLEDKNLLQNSLLIGNNQMIANEVVEHDVPQIDEFASNQIDDPQSEQKPKQVQSPIAAKVTEQSENNDPSQSQIARQNIEPVDEVKAELKTETDLSRESESESVSVSESANTSNAANLQKDVTQILDKEITPHSLSVIELPITREQSNTTKIIPTIDNIDEKEINVAQIVDDIIAIKIDPEINRNETKIAEDKTENKSENNSDDRNPPIVYENIVTEKLAFVSPAFEKIEIGIFEQDNKDNKNDTDKAYENFEIKNNTISVDQSDLFVSKNVENKVSNSDLRVESEHETEIVIMTPVVTPAIEDSPTSNANNTSKQHLSWGDPMIAARIKVKDNESEVEAVKDKEVSGQGDIVAQNTRDVVGQGEVVGQKEVVKAEAEESAGVEIIAPKRLPNYPPTAPHVMPPVINKEPVNNNNSSNIINKKPDKKPETVAMKIDNDRDITSGRDTKIDLGRNVKDDSDANTDSGFATTKRGKISREEWENYSEIPTEKVLQETINNYHDDDAPGFSSTRSYRQNNPKPIKR
ncbi:MAG: tetratricopeptide repeat protein [Planctomycetaceae bacterium]|nr:tetratricopeptide repeat protein [Planctomycetaceae bacterium]